MRQRLTLLFLVSTVFVACSASEMGLQQMNAGRNREAFATFTKCANQGDPYCVNNLGVMYQRGLATGQPNPDKAAEYYTLAARMGLPIARQNLIDMGRPVPTNDLEAAYQADKARKAREWGRLGDQLVQASHGNYSPPPAATPPQGQAYRPYTPIVPPATAPKAYVRVDCSSDAQCKPGEVCVRPVEAYGNGSCVVPTDDLGIPMPHIPPATAGVHEVIGCEWFTDCPIGFNCVKKRGQMYGLCLKR